MKSLQNRVVKSRLELIGRITVNVAHDICNPLDRLRTGIEYIHKTSQSSDKNLIFVLDSMKTSLETMDKVLRELLDLANTDKISPEAENIHSVLDEALHCVKNELVQNDIAVVKDYFHLTPPIRIERDKIKRILTHLFTNAIEAMPAGGTLQLKTSVQTLNKVGKRVGRRKDDVFRPGEKVVVIEAEDTGMGVPKEILKKAFEPFVTTKSASGGNGLGLAITAWVMDLHQGTVDIENNPEGGARVTLKFRA